MKRLLIFMMVLMLLVPAPLSVSAEDGNVIYSGDSGEFIFEPGTGYSPTDLFPDFKEVMPGDLLTQNITVKNEASNNVKVEIYIRSLGAHDDEQSQELLSQLELEVVKLTDTVLFDAEADETAQLTKWTCLGTLYSGGEVDLEVILKVPDSLDNTYALHEGYLDWEFMVKEFPIEDDDPEPPTDESDSEKADSEKAESTPTGDDTNFVWHTVLFCCLGAMLTNTCILYREKNKK